MTFGCKPERDLERLREREARALRREPVVDDGPARAQCGDADVGRDADDAFAIVDGGGDDAGDRRAVNLAVARERMLGDEIARERARGRASRDGRRRRRSR